MKLKAREHPEQTQIINFLKGNGFYVIRINSGVIRGSYTYRVGLRKGSVRNWTVRLAEKGTPDILAFKPGTLDPAESGKDHGEVDLYFFEVKREGQSPEEVQVRKMKELEEYGAKCFVVHNMEEVKKIIDNDN